MVVLISSTEFHFRVFAIETFPDGSLQTQMSLMHGREDGVTRRWHANGQLESEKSFRAAPARHPPGVAARWRACDAIDMERRRRGRRVEI